MKNVLLACLLCMLVCSCNSRQYKVEGNVTGLDDGTVVQLVPMSHDNESPIAEATVNGGKFTFKGEIGDSLPMPICVNLMVKDAFGAETFMLDKDTDKSLKINFAVCAVLAVVAMGYMGYKHFYLDKIYLGTDMEVAKILDKLGLDSLSRNLIDKVTAYYGRY